MLTVIILHSSDLNAKNDPTLGVASRALDNRDIRTSTVDLDGTESCTSGTETSGDEEGGGGLRPFRLPPTIKKKTKENQLGSRSLEATSNDGTGDSPERTGKELWGGVHAANVLVQRGPVQPAARRSNVAEDL